MKRHDLPSHKALDARLGILKDLVKDFSEEYRWTLGMVFEPSRQEQAIVSGGGVSQPTESVAIGKAGQRDLVRSALRQIEEVEAMMRSALGYLREAQPKYAPVEEKGIGWPAPWLPGCGPKDRRKQAELKAKREAQGGGYGSS